MLVGMFAANAQTYFLQEGFEGSEIPSTWTVIDADGDGYGWSLTNGEFVTHTGTGCATSASWVTGAGALTPDNWLVTPAVTLTANATLSFWVAGQDPSYASENYSVYISTTGNSTADFTTQIATGVSTATMTQTTVDLSSYTGQTVYIAFRHHNVSDMFRINLDDVEVFATPTEPTINVSATSLNFGSASAPNSVVRNVDVTAYNLTAPITVTATAPFTVSSNGSSYGATASIPQTGGTLYVKFAPTAAQTYNSTVALTSGSVSQNITVTGVGVDCSNAQTLPFVEDFEGDVFPPSCWTILSTSTTTWEPYGGEASCSYGSVGETQDERLITPAINLSNYVSASLSFVFAANYTYIHNDDPQEQYNLQVLASTDGGNTFPTLLYDLREDAGSFENWERITATANLSALVGQPNVKIAFKYYGMYGAQLIIDDINITGTVGVNEYDNEARVYPNPTTNMVNVETSSALKHIEIFNMNGQKVNDVQADGFNATVNTSSLSNGVYMMKIYTENGVSHNKLSVAR